MFSAGEIAKSIHAVAQCIQTIRASNTGSPAEEDALKPTAPPSLLKSNSLSSNGISSILSQPHQSAPNVSVVSSSMDFFGAPESALLPQPPDARSNLTLDSYRVTSMDTSGNSRKTSALKSDDHEQKPSALPTTNKRIRLDDVPPQTTTLEQTRAVPPPSFEQAAIVAALEHLYGKGAGVGVKKHMAGGDTLTSSGKFTEVAASTNFQETSPSPSSLPPKKFQHISRALLGTTNSSSFRGSKDLPNADRSAAAMAQAMGPRPSMPQAASYSQALRPSLTAEASNFPPGSKKPSYPGSSPSGVLPKKAPYLDTKPSAAKQSKKSPEADDDDDDEEAGSEFEYNDSKFYSSKSPMVLQPSAYDVLLGRGKSNKNHPGNKRFQDCIQANRERYFNALTNVAKRDITMEILQFIRQKGRFLRRGAHGWVDVPTPDIQQKVAHALQYRRRCVIKEKTGVARPRPGSPPQHPSNFPKKMAGASMPQQGGVPNTNTLDPNFLSLALSSSIANRLQVARDNDYELVSAENAIAKHKQQMRDMEYYQSHLGQLLRSSGSKFMEKKEAEDEDQQQVEEYVKQLQQQQFTTSAVQQYLLQNARPSSAMQHRAPLLPEVNIGPSRHIPASLPRDMPQSQAPPPSDNLDSSGLHSLADVISRIYSQDQKDITLARSCHGA